jgi:hypothetical protein
MKERLASRPPAASELMRVPEMFKNRRAMIVAYERNAKPSGTDNGKKQKETA